MLNRYDIKLIILENAYVVCSYDENPTKLLYKLL
jgi:hypothetical protein